VFLNVPKEIRLQRLVKRQRDRFGQRIEVGGDMHDEHEAFIEWAGEYEDRPGKGRNLTTDREFLLSHSDRFMSLDKIADIEAIVGEIARFLE
jgi:hypothetical protein